jgi:hypothetical protein
MSLFDASVDLNPHQIEAAMFALKSLLSALSLPIRSDLEKPSRRAFLMPILGWKTPLKDADVYWRLLVTCPAAVVPADMTALRPIAAMYAETWGGILELLLPAGFRAVRGDLNWVDHPLAIINSWCATNGIGID